jgi:hypothetical protein
LLAKDIFDLSAENWSNLSFADENKLSDSYLGSNLTFV